MTAPDEFLAGGQRQLFYLRSPSQLSFSTCETQPTTVNSTLRTGTFTSNGRSTIPGIGALSGSAIKAVGRFTLGAVEYASLHLKLNAISRILKPSGLRAISEEADSVEESGYTTQAAYEDILELSRVGLYPSSIVTRALSTILVQIASHRIHPDLFKALQKWPAIEIGVFMSTILTCLDPQWPGSSLQNGRQLRKEYKANLSTLENHPITPFLDFLSDAADSDTRLCSLIFLSGALDVLLHIYCVNFYGGHSTNVNDELIRAWRRLYLHSTNLPAEESEVEVLRKHPLHSLWSSELSLPSTDGSKILADYHLRAEAWQRLPPLSTRLRKPTIEEVCSGAQSHITLSRFMFMDLVCFARLPDDEINLWLGILPHFYAMSSQERRLICNGVLEVMESYSSPSSEKLISAEPFYKVILQLLGMPSQIPTVRTALHELLLTRIGSRRTAGLQEALVGRPATEIRDLLTAIAAYIIPQWRPARKDGQAAPANESRHSESDSTQGPHPIYLYALFAGEMHPMLPFVDFLTSMALQGDSACDLLVVAGALDIFKYICRNILGFVDPLAGDGDPVKTDAAFVSLLDSCTWLAVSLRAQFLIPSYRKKSARAHGSYLLSGTLTLPGADSIWLTY